MFVMQLSGNFCKNRSIITGRVEGKAVYQNFADDEASNVTE